MKLYEKYYKNNFEELIHLLPSLLQGRFPRWWKSSRRLAEWRDGLEANIEQTYLNNFILTADAETIKVWEDLLEITYTRPLTLDQRKRVVIARDCGVRPHRGAGDTGNYSELHGEGRCG